MPRGHRRATASPNSVSASFSYIFLAFCNILQYKPDSASILPFILRYKANSAATLPLPLIYTADVATFLPLILLSDPRFASFSLDVPYILVEFPCILLIVAV